MNNDLYINAPMCFQKDCLYFDTGYCMSSLDKITPNTIYCEKMKLKSDDPKEK